METRSIVDAPLKTRTPDAPQRVPAALWRWRPQALVPYLFSLPFLLLFAAFFVAPFLFAFWQSLYKEQHNGLGFGPPTTIWAGAENYIKAVRDPHFWDGLGRVLLFGSVQIPVMMLVALVLALLMDSTVVRFRRFFRLAFFVPYAVPGVVAAIMWGFFYSPASSPIIQIVTALHLPAPNFLGETSTLWSIANISTWTYTGYNMIIFYSALQGIPQEIYESGRLDGLSETGIALRLKLPLILPAIIFGLLFSMVGTLQLFNEPLVLKNLSSAITSNYTPNIFAYNVAVVNTDFNYGGAIAVILGAVTFIFSFGFLRLTRGYSGA
ncbi:MAG TPA: sugar ABC transporter permease [Ktedonobacterales bacterium]|nr:sugar ABC transporter permease [Ktedonobacterales bacterium]HEX5570169.1 sugar ABC transporter permease [Ktedonobacterales bacterium]